MFDDAVDAFNIFKFPITFLYKFKFFIKCNLTIKIRISSSKAQTTEWTSSHHSNPAN